MFDFASFASGFSTGFFSEYWPKLISWFSEIWVIVTYIAYGVSLVALFVIIYTTVRLFELRKREEDFYSTRIASPRTAISGAHPRWQHIEALAGGKSESEWREAIIEADILLDELLDKQGYAGATIGEKLKVADIRTLNDAWEAHKVRNLIAHEGSSFKLTPELTHRTITRFKNVFQEFNAI
jgi:hypothetical protein